MNLVRKVVEAFRRYRLDRRLIEIDSGALIWKYGADAVARALELDATGALSRDRRAGHWARVARCISGRPSPTRSAVALDAAS